MGLKFYVGEAQTRSSQASQLNGQAGQAIASLQRSIQLFLAAPLSSKAYDSAKNYFMIAYTPLCQSAIMTGEALESAHKKFLSDYQGSVSGIDTDEDLILEEINRFEDLKRALDQQMSTAKTPRPDLERRYMNACDVITQRREKLAKFHSYNGRSASIFSEYQACQQEFNAGLAQVKECKAWNSASGTFDIGRLNMTWAKPITTRWEKREKLKQEKLKNGSTGKANTLADHGLTKADLVQVSDSPEVVYQKYAKFAALGLNPHTGKPLTDKEKWQFQYAAYAGPTTEVIGLVGGAYAGEKAAKANFYKGNGSKKVSEAGGFNIDEIRPKLKTDPDTAFFWSGRTEGVGGADIAANVAKGKGGTTLEATIANKNIKIPEWDFNNPSSMEAWDLASGAYAEQVSGQVRAVVGSELRPGNIWENVELPRLTSNPEVTKITTIDPKTGIEKIIFERK